MGKRKQVAFHIAKGDSYSVQSRKVLGGPGGRQKDLTCHTQLWNEDPPQDEVSFKMYGWSIEYDEDTWCNPCVHMQLLQKTSVGDREVTSDMYFTCKVKYNQKECTPQGLACMRGAYNIYKMGDETEEVFTFKRGEMHCYTNFNSHGWDPMCSN